MKLLSTLHIPMMKNKNQVMTINNFAKVHWAVKSKVKNYYKELIKTWFLSDEKLPNNLHFDVQPVYKDARRRDTINVAPSLKVFEDCLTEAGIIEDDDNTSFMLRPKLIDCELKEHELRIKIYERIENGNK